MLYICNNMCAQMCPLFVTPWTVACQAPLSMEFSRQDYWSGLPFPTLDIYNLWNVVMYVAHQICLWL